MQIQSNCALRALYSRQRYELIMKKNKKKKQKKKKKRKKKKKKVRSDVALWKSGQSTVGPGSSFSNSL